MRYEKKVVVLSSTLAALFLIWAAGFAFSPDRVAANLPPEQTELAHALARLPSHDRVARRRRRGRQRERRCPVAAPARRRRRT